MTSKSTPPTSLTAREWSKGDLAQLQALIERLLDAHAAFPEAELALVSRLAHQLQDSDPEDLAWTAAASLHRSLLLRGALAGLLDVSRGALMSARAQAALATHAAGLQESMTDLLRDELALRTAMATERARRSVGQRHSKPGGARDKQHQLRLAWASGKYTSRDRCAEEEACALGMSFAAARRALRNTPDPT